MLIYIKLTFRYVTNSIFFYSGKIYIEHRTKRIQQLIKTINKKLLNLEIVINIYLQLEV